MPLTDAAKPKDKPYKLFDSGGLSVLVQSNGSKFWRFKYRIEGKEKLLALGQYPKIKEAREAHSKARALLIEIHDKVIGAFINRYHFQIY